MYVFGWSDDEIVDAAAKILESRAARGGEEPAIGAPAEASKIASLRLGALEYEAFSAFWLDAQNRLIEYEQLFRGTLTQTSVYPRELARSAMRTNAAAVILAHNHPSGSLDPSSADKHLTDTLKKALAMIDVRVLDHLIVSGTRTASMAELGLV
jgi:DNA repair protein RadC